MTLKKLLNCKRIQQFNEIKKNSWAEWEIEQRYYRKEQNRNLGAWGIQWMK